MEIKTRQVVIRPINRPEFSGITAHAKTVLPMGGAQLDKTGSYKTGLTVAEEAEFERELNLPKGTLNKRNSAFWGSLEIRLFRDKPTYFEVASLMDELKYRTLLARNTVANSELEIKKNAYALFYIEDAEAKAKVEEIAMDHLFDAVEAFTQMTSTERRGFLKLYGDKGVDDLSDMVVKTMLYKKVNADPEKFTRLVKDPDISLRISIEEKIEAGLIKKNGQYYKYEDEVIGNSVDAVVSFFKDMKNQSLKLTMEAEVNSKKKKTKE